jgi:uncharacterized protein
MSRKLIGHIMSGSLTEGLLVRIIHDVPISEIKTGKFVSVVSNACTFFALISDLSLQVSNQEILQFPPESDQTLLHDVLLLHGMYATAIIRPMIMRMGTMLALVKTLPQHFAPVYEANIEDITAIFGSESNPTNRYFSLGTLLDMNMSICIDLDKLTERSSGVFGKTGTGKTFITRLLLAGIIKHEKASLLIFDMHSEYGVQARQENAQNNFVKGLKTLFAHKVLICSIDPATTRRRGTMADIELTIPLQAIHVDDILSLQHELNLHTTALEAAYLLVAYYQHNWLIELLAHGNSIKAFAENIGAHPESLAALYRKLKRITLFPFFTTHTTPFCIIDQIMEHIERGMSIIIEFGNYTSSFVYLLVANIITRRIHKLYVQKTEQFLSSQHTTGQPQKLIICVEEAHKFLNHLAASQTIFGTIAKEMRKYYVSLLIVDQRPSAIDAEVLSQIGTKIIAQLHDEHDIAAVLSGAHNALQLRHVLSSLDSKKQVLVIGHAITMPVVVQTRSYDQLFYATMQKDEPHDIRKIAEQIF